MSGPVIVLSIMLFVAVLLAGLVYLYTAAGQAYRQDRESYALYRKHLQAARRDYHWIRKQTESNWPIWPRPLLFGELDHHTQRTLGQAGYAMEVLERCFAALEAIDPLDTGDSTLLNVPENIRRIRAGAANRKRLAEFDQFYPLIEAAKHIIRENQNEIVASKKSIRESVAELSRNLELADANIQFFYALGAARYEDAMKNIAMTQDCLNYAEMEMHEAEQADLVEWATAYVLYSAGALSFDIFNLKGKSFTFSEAYEADLVLDKLNQLSDELEAGLDYARFHDWAYLVATQNRLDGLRAEFATSEELLAGFDALVQKFKVLVNQLSNINIDDLSQNAVRAQRELEDYLGAPHESADWERIQSPYEPPALLLGKKKLQFTQEIEPAFQGMVIRQSELPRLIDSVTDFLLGIKKIDALINHLEIWTQENQRCEQAVRQLLSRGGEVETLVRRVAEFSNDSTPAIMRASQGIRQAFRRSRERAFGPRQQAGFIALLKDVRTLGRACDTLIAQHEDAVEALQIEAVSTYRALQQAHNRLFEEYQPRRPAISSINWGLVRQEFNAAAQQYDTRGNAYSAILGANKTMRALIATENRLIRSCEQQFSAYKAQYNYLSKQITRGQIEIGRTIETLQKNWSRPLSEFITILRAYYEQYRRLAEQLQLLQQAPSMEEAQRTLEVIDQNATQLDEMRYALVDHALGLKYQLDELKKYVDSLKNRKLSENNMKAWSGANKNISAAEQTNDPVKAQAFLNQATWLLEHANLYQRPARPTPVNVRSSKLEKRRMVNKDK